MNCNLGQVVDLSASGIRVLSKKPLTGEQTVTLKGMGDSKLSLRARVLWHRQHAASEHIHGLSFESLTAQQHEELEALILALTEGSKSPTVAEFAGFGKLGMAMLVSAGVLFLAAVSWGVFNPSIQVSLPKLYDALNAVPELGALLVIAAGGCGLLGIAQRSASENSRTDTQRRHRAQIELDYARQSQNTLNSILESSLGGVCVLDTQRDEAGQCTGFQIQLVNPAGEQLIGKPEKELVGQTIEQALPELISHQLYKD
ncbi:MAG: PilZ domain-containing protein, partial [Phycisphaeraceae bacterium]